MSSSRWLNKWKKEHEKAGGFAGRATIAALIPLALQFRSLGATTRVAGMATAIEYKLYSSREDWKELAQSAGLGECRA